MARRSSKTEHVMKLITKDAGAAGESPEPENNIQEGGEAEDMGENTVAVDETAAGAAESAVEPAGAGDAAAEGVAEAAEGTAAAAPAPGKGKKAAAADKAGAGGVEASVKAAEGNELNYKTKLKIEIEPEIEIKETSKSRPDGAIGPRAIGTRAGGNAVPVTRAVPSAKPGTESKGRRAGKGMAAADDQIPDGVPYENRDDWQVPQYQEEEGYDYEAEAAGVGDASGEAPDMDDYGVEQGGAGLADGAGESGPTQQELDDRESARQQDERRRKKIMIENELLNSGYNLVNLSEVLTKELLPSVMEKMELCTCRLCTNNVLALTLNSLPTKYVTTDRGKQFTQLEVYKSQYELDVLAALTKACLKVKSSPRHEIIEDDIDR